MLLYSVIKTETTLVVRVLVAPLPHTHKNEEICRLSSLSVAERVNRVGAHQLSRVTITSKSKIALKKISIHEIKKKCSFHMHTSTEQGN